MTTRVKFEDLELAFDYVSFGAMGEHAAYFCRDSGSIYWHSEIGDSEEELPDDIDDTGKYVAIPDKRELDLGKPLVFDFVRQFLPADYDKVREIFSRRGAYARFRDLLSYRNAVKQWQDFEAKATKDALREWCARNAIELAD